jgi:hypothetical protein
MCAATGHVRFSSNSDRESRHRQTVMSALPLKADMCSAASDVGYGPEADIVFDRHLGENEPLSPSELFPGGLRNPVI